MENNRGAMKRVVAVILALAVVVQQSASGLQIEQEFYTTQGPNFQDGSGSKGGFWPMVNVDTQNNRTKTDVHIPAIFDMTNDKNIAGGDKLDLSVLGGLVTVNKDRTKQPNGASTGPLVVTVFGIPVYTGYGGRRGVFQRINDVMAERKVRSEPTTDPPPSAARSLATNDNVNSTGQITNEKLVSTVAKTNERVLQSLAGTFEKFSNFVTQASPISNTNGQAAGKSHGFVAPSRFLPIDLKPKVVVPKGVPDQPDEGPHDSHIHV